MIKLVQAGGKVWRHLLGGINVAHITRGSASLMHRCCHFDLLLHFKTLFFLFLIIHHRLCPKTRRTLFLLKLGSFQFAVMKLAFTILSVVLYTNDLFDLSDVSPVTPLPAVNLSRLVPFWIDLTICCNISEKSELTLTPARVQLLRIYFTFDAFVTKGIKQA